MLPIITFYNPTSFKNYWIKEGRVKNREPKRNTGIKELYKTGEVLQIYNAGTKVYVWIIIIKIKSIYVKYY